GLLRKPILAVVGSRNHTSYGAAACRLIVGAAAGAGIVVASGRARGLDAVAHRTALDTAGGTVGLLGNGLGVIYPTANRALYDAVVAHGLLLTEFPPGERPHAGSFPRRNRLIIGLARATVGWEAGSRAGNRRGGGGVRVGRPDPGRMCVGAGAGSARRPRADHEPHVARCEPA